MVFKEIKACVFLQGWGAAQHNLECFTVLIKTRQILKS